MASPKKVGAAAVVLTSVGNGRDAQRLARQLLARRVCACVSIVGPVRSLYWWKGRVSDEREVLLVVKTVRGRVGVLKAAIRELHPYEVPEVLVLDAEASGEYLRWLRVETRVVGGL